ncbi:MAG: NTP transferase domain-containing protein [bacterium]
MLVRAMVNGCGVSKGVDAIVMAGDGRFFRPVYRTHKGLLEIEGESLLSYVISSLQRCRYVSRIFVVGPADRLSHALERVRASGAGAKEIVLVNQWSTMLENAWNTFLQTLPKTDPNGRPYSEEALRERYEDKAVLVLGCDMPLLTHFELEEFVQGCDLDNYDFLIGTTPLETLRAYEPRTGMPGIRLAHFCFRDSRERQNNLHMIRFFRVINREYAHIMYRYRYQKRWKNVLALLWRFIRLPEVRPGMVVRFLLLHGARWAEQLNRRGLLALLTRTLDKSRIERDISRLLKTRFGSVVTTYGGAALDVDNEAHFEIVRRQFRRWLDYQEALHEERTRDRTGQEDPEMRSLP